MELNLFGAIFAMNNAVKTPIGIDINKDKKETSYLGL
jgi:hypothetical protein